MSAIKIKMYHLTANGDKESFDRLFTALFPRLTAYATLFLEPDVAEDVVQDLFVYLWNIQEN